MTTACEPVGPGIYAIDSQYGGKPQNDAIHLIVDEGHAAFVDTGTYFSIPNMLDALAELDLDTADVDYILLTHVHLDHAGGASGLAKLLPRAQVRVHPRGMMHVVDPTVLVAATQSVYGVDAYDRLYGSITPIDAARVAPAEDGQYIMLGKRRLDFLHTPGHALHHLCIALRDSGEVFTGDTFGLSYRATDTAAGPFIFPSTTPSQFDPLQLHTSIQRVVDLDAGSAYLTHYSKVTGIEKLAEDLHRDIDRFVEIARTSAGSPQGLEGIEQRLYEYLSKRLDLHGFAGDDAQRHRVLDGDIALNAAGLMAWASRVRS